MSWTSALDDDDVRSGSGASLTADNDHHDGDDDDDDDDSPVTFRGLVRAAADGDLEVLAQVRAQAGIAPYWSEVAVAALEAGHYAFWRAYLALARPGLVFPVPDPDPWWVRCGRDLVFRDVVSARVGRDAAALLRVVADDVFRTLPTPAEAAADPDWWDALGRTFAAAGQPAAAPIWSDDLYGMETPRDLSVAALFAIDAENVPLLDLIVDEWRFRCGYEHLMRAARTYNAVVYGRVLRSAWPDAEPESAARLVVRVVSMLVCCGMDLVGCVRSEPYLPPPCLPSPAPPHDGDLIWKVLMAADRRHTDPLLQFLNQFPALLDALPSLADFLRRLIADPDCATVRHGADWLRCFLLHNRRDPIGFAQTALRLCDAVVALAPSAWGLTLSPRPLDFASDPIHVRTRPGYYPKERQRPEFERDWRYYRRRSST